MTELATAAVGYTQRGWQVFPLVPRRKVPLTRRGLLDASCDPELVAAWWQEQPSANIGIACGPSGLLVVDLDGEQGAAAWQELTARHGRPQDTLAAETAKGLHFYFAGEARSTAGRLGRGIDTRGAGGYVVAPPSVHESGRVYRWHDADAPVVPLPAWVPAALKPVGSTEAGEPRELTEGAPYTRYGLAALSALVDEMAATSEGQRNVTLNALAYRAGRLAGGGQLAEQVAREELLAAAAQAGLEDGEAQTTFQSGFQAGLQRPVAIEERRRR